MQVSARDAQISRLNRFLDDLELAAGAGTFDRAFNAPPSGVRVYEINLEKKFTRVSPGDLLG